MNSQCVWLCDAVQTSSFAVVALKFKNLIALMSSFAVSHSVFCVILLLFFRFQIVFGFCLCELRAPMYMQTQMCLCECILRLCVFSTLCFVCNGTITEERRKKSHDLFSNTFNRASSQHRTEFQLSVFCHQSN